MSKSWEKLSKQKRSFGHDYGREVQVDVASSAYTGTYGLEFELEGISLPLRNLKGSYGGATWNYADDGSLRGPNGRREAGSSAEYVLSQPIDKEFVEPAVQGLFDSLREARIINSTRCSTHVHVNMRGMKLNHVAAFVALWGTFEDVLANWCGSHRSGNHFAIRFSDSGFAVYEWIRAFKSGEFNFPPDYRYQALNPASLAKFGSLEVRTMRGVDNAAEVLPWIDAIDAIYRKARETGNPSDFAVDFSGTGPRIMAENLFGIAFTQELIAATDALGESFDARVGAGFRRIQPLLYALPWADVLEEIAKPYVPDPFAPTGKKRKPTIANPMDELRVEINNRMIRPPRFPR